MAKKKEAVKQEAVKEEAIEEVKKEEVVAPVGGLKRIKVTQEELMKLQADCKLVGYDPATKEAIVR